MTRLLRRLDERLLPPVGDVLARLLRGAVRMWVFTTVVAVLAVTVTLLVVHASGQRTRTDPTLGDVLRVGVGEGGSIPLYVTDSRAELAGLPAEREVHALVSFSVYLAPDRLAPVLDGVAVSSVFARVPLSGRQTELIRLGAYKLPDDVRAAMASTAQRKETEAANYRTLLAKAADRPEEQRQVYAAGAELAAAEAEAYRRHCSCVYAAVIFGGATALRALAERTEVRVVDPITDLRRLDRTVFLPPLPEQAQVAEPPGSAPSGGPVSSGPG